MSVREKMMKTDKAATRAVPTVSRLSRAGVPRARLRRRDFLALAALSPALANLTDAATAAAENPESPPRRRLLFTSQGKTGIVNTDGSGLRYFDFQIPGQAT